MKTPLQVIADFGCPTHSYIAAMQHFGDREDLSIEQYRAGIQEVVGLTELPETESYHFAKVLFLYVVQETIRAYLTGIVPDMAEIYVHAISRTYEYIKSNPWAVTRFNIMHGLLDVEETNPETGVVTITKPKQAKKDVTERIFKEFKARGASRQDIIDTFILETGMSKAGATTYFHSLKKTLGFKESDTDEKKLIKVESKQDLAERVYQESQDKSKPAMIALFIEKLGTSKLGAQTYYYACKKKCNTSKTI